jgi:hypothetical protein
MDQQETAPAFLIDRMVDESGCVPATRSLGALFETKLAEPLPAIRLPPVGAGLCKHGEDHQQEYVEDPKGATSPRQIVGQRREFDDEGDVPSDDPHGPRSDQDLDQQPNLFEFGPPRNDEGCTDLRGDRKIGTERVAEGSVPAGVLRASQFDRFHGRR